MVKNIMSLTGNGLSDWLLQRITAVILALYTVFIVAFLLSNPDLTFANWQQLFSLLWVKLFTLLTVLSIFAHAWVGMWTVATDYIKNTMVRVFFEIFFVLVLAAYVVVTVLAIWSL